MKVSYEGVAEQVATFQVDGASNPAVQVGTVGRHSPATAR